MPIRGVEYIPKSIGHPGVPLAAKLQELDMSPKDFAKQIDADIEVIIDIIMEKEEAVITPELAESFHKALGIPANYWLRGQDLYNKLVSNKKKSVLLTKTTV